MSLREYLREKAAESRHNEMSAYLMFIAGSILFVGGILETHLVAERVEWISFIPVAFSSSPGTILGLAMTVSGLALIVFGLVTGIFFSRDRIWYIRELRANELGEKRSLNKKRRKRVTT